MFFLATFKDAVKLNDIADPNCFETKQLLANIV
jgi:tetraacyldisaccharide-1-P 4'-kinase